MAWIWALIKPLRTLLLALFFSILLGFGLVGCSRDRIVDVSQVNQGKQEKAAVSRRLSEVAPPQAIQELGQILSTYQPQVKILSPRSNQTLQDSQVAVQLQVKDLPIFKNEAYGLGPHLHLILDNQPYQAVYDTSDPVVFSDLEPGTHTLRVFASRPWHESFKNEGAYDQVTFNILTETPDNNPAPDAPLLTYSRPKGSYGAEPIMLDFYLRNAPLHLVAREDAKDDILDWRIRCTINGESFVFDQWQPVYLKGFQPGQNWVKLEFINEIGQSITNAFNTTVRLIDYQPGGNDTLSQIIRGELAIADIQGIVDPNYTPPTAEPSPSPSPTPPAPEAAPPAEAPNPPEPEATQPPASKATEPKVTKPSESEPSESEPSEVEPLAPAGTPKPSETSKPSEKSAAPESETASPTSLQDKEAETAPELELIEKPVPDTVSQPKPETPAQPAQPAEPAPSSIKPETLDSETLDSEETSPPSTTESKSSDAQADSAEESPAPAVNKAEPTPDAAPVPSSQPEAAPEAPAEAGTAPSNNTAESNTTQSEGRFGRIFKRFQRPAPAPTQDLPQTLPEIVEDQDIESVQTDVSADTTEFKPNRDSDAQVQPADQSLGKPQSSQSAMDRLEQEVESELLEETES